MSGYSKQLGAFLLAFHLAVMCPFMCVIHCWLSDQTVNEPTSMVHYVCVLHSPEVDSQPAFAATKLSSTNPQGLVSIFSIVMLMISVLMIYRQTIRAVYVQKSFFNSLILSPQPPPPRTFYSII